MKGRLDLSESPERAEDDVRVATRRTTCFAAAAVLICMTQPAHAQSDAQKAALQDALKKQYNWTTITADRSDIVTPGDVFVLHKSGLAMCGVNAPLTLVNTYKNGGLSANQMSWAMSLGLAGVQSSGIPQRKFVAGEKFWVVDYKVQKDGVLLELYSDPYNDIRYYGLLKIPFAKGSIPPADEVLKAIAEVVTVQPADTSTQSAPTPAPVAPATATLQPLAPPPPPIDAPPAPPKTIALGQTKDQVVATLGQPQKMASLGAKEIYYYPDMKVTLVNGKVTDIQ